MERNDEKLAHPVTLETKPVSLDFLSFLNPKKTWDSDNYTHTMMHPNNCKFNIDKESFEDFWRLYQAYRSKEPIGITERPQAYAQVIVDIDISIPYKNQPLTASFYNSKHIKTVVEIYQNVLKSMVVNITDDQLLCIVLTKPPYIKNDKISNGFHLQFPNLFLNQQQQEVYLIPKIKLNLKDSKVFENLGIENSSDTVDKLYRKLWLVYGSVKGDGMDSYQVTGAYKYLEGKTIATDHIEALSKCVIYDSKGDQIQVTEQNLKTYLPRILSIFPFGRMTSEIQGTSFKEIRKLMPTKKTLALQMGNKINDAKTKKYREVPFAKKMKDLENVVMLLSPKRAEDYNLWFEVGTIIYNVSNGLEEGFKIWNKFSKRCPEKYDELSCYYYWNRYYFGNVSMGTLIYYVKQDNPAAYKKYRDAENRNFVANMSSTHYDVAMFLYRQFRETFVCADIKHNEWYRYENHCWNECQEGYSLVVEIPNMLYEQLKIVKKTIKRSIDKIGSKKKKHGSDSENSDDESNSDQESDFESFSDDEETDEEDEKKKNEEKKNKEGQLKKVNGLMNNLKTAPFVKNVMHFTKILFFDPYFHRKLNSNKHLFGVKNGVLDAKMGIFREGKPDDYITTQAGFEYRSYDKNDIEVSQVKKYLEQVFPNPNIREYFMNRQSQIFMGGNLQKVIEIWSGDRDNAKSTTVKILEILLDKLSAKIPASMGTGERTAAGSANPEVARLGNGVRKMFMQEPSGKRKFNVAVLKELAGNDTMFARMLHKNGGEITVQADLVIVCNKIPALDAVDAAIIKRLKVIPFESTFTEEAPESKEEQMLKKVFPVDRTLENRLCEFVPAFAWLLFERWKKIKDRLNTLIEPKEVRQATDSYIEDNDFFKRFFVLHTKKTNSDNDRIYVTDFYSSFKDWMKDSFSTVYSCDKYEFRKAMNKLFKHEAVNNVWNGFKIVNEDGEEKGGKKKFITGDAKKKDQNTNPMQAQINVDSEDEDEKEVNDGELSGEPVTETVNLTSITESPSVGVTTSQDQDEYNAKPKRFLTKSK